MSDLGKENSLDGLPENGLLHFSVDAGIINRLGAELVGKSETAVAELIKNAYDADATVVEVTFVSTEAVGGLLLIEDNGLGMDFNDLSAGFMRLSSTAKVHEPYSRKFRRKRAGQKGIGRFATQHLGTVLRITTQKEDMEKALCLVISWNDYLIDTNLSEVGNKVEWVERMPKASGTNLEIKGLRHSWNLSEIRRVFRYVSGLLQPDFVSDRAKPSFLSDRDKQLVLASETGGENVFSVLFKRQTSQGGAIENVASSEKLIHEKAVAVIEAYVDNKGEAFCCIHNKRLGLDDEIEPIGAGNDINIFPPFALLRNVQFKAYYHIYNRPEYYEFDAGFTKHEYKKIQEMASEASGIRIYRNGFRVYPYGKSGNDWLEVDRKLRQQRVNSGVHIPFANNNLFGFVEIIERPGQTPFEETASREGLVENAVFDELKDFAFKVLKKAMSKTALSEELRRIKDLKDGNKPGLPPAAEAFEQINTQIADIKRAVGKKEDEETVFNMLGDLSEKVAVPKKIIENQIEELGMLRVLAGIGLVIGEYVHEIEQFDTIFSNYMLYLKNNLPDNSLKEKLDELKSHFESYKSFSAYFRASISQNNRRNMQPINLKTSVNAFMKQVEADAKKAQVQIAKDFDTPPIETCPMHPSEWMSILFNLYSNSTKAIRRGKNRGQGRILIQLWTETDTSGLSKAVLAFHDNGDGINAAHKHKIFTAFFTTSNPVDPDASDLNENTGTGLGLYIVKNIIDTYGGTIELVAPKEGYNTCFKIILPSHKPKIDGQA